LLATLEALGAAGIGAAGAGADLDAAHRPWITERGGLRAAFLAFTQPMNRLPRSRQPPAWVARLDPVERALASVAAARREADLVVVSTHWGHDFQPAPTESQRALARELIRAGADVILGTGPHVLHPVERFPSPRGQALVAFSLGNLISPQGRSFRADRQVEGHPALVDPRAREAVVLRVEVTRSPSGQISIGAVEALPLWTRNNHLELLGGETRPEIRVVPMAEDPVGRLRLDAVARALGPEVHVQGRPLASPDAGAEMQVDATPDAGPIKADLVVVDSRELVLIASREGRELRRYPVEIGQGGVGKRRLGDLRTPRGRYRLLQAIPSRRYRHFLRVSYPNARDVQRGFSRGLITRTERDALIRTIGDGGLPRQDTKLGGNIGLHAPSMPPSAPRPPMDQIPRRLEKTQGCIVMHDEDLEDFLEIFQPGVALEIR
jgi:hypothetical protein